MQKLYVFNYQAEDEEAVSSVYVCDSRRLSKARKRLIRRLNKIRKKMGLEERSEAEISLKMRKLYYKNGVIHA